MMRRSVLLVVLAMVALAVPVSAQPAIPVTGAPGNCAELAGRPFGDLGTLRTATEQTINGHRFCVATAEMPPHTGVQLMLPLQGWAGQYVQQGCSGLCGTSAVGAAPETGLTCQPVTSGHVAMAKDDTGHVSDSVNDGTWGADPALRTVFGRTSEHSTALLAKAVLRAFYGAGPRYSYFDGCSTGGRQALVEAQDHPADFDGILAGAPAINMNALGFAQAWLVRSNSDRDGHQILPAEKLPALHAAVIATCGDSTGTVSNPRACAFDPASIQCHGADTDSCLTPAQVATVRAFYRGPTTPSGLQLFNSGAPYGSELGWRSWAVMPRADTAAPGDTQAAQIALNGFKYLAYPVDPPATFTLADLRFTVDQYLRGQQYAQRTYNATNPDLRAFAARGGKLILYHGLADEAIFPQSTVDYYAWVERLAGGFTASQRFSRLYLVPGAYHCLFGPDLLNPTRVNGVDFLTELLGWVEHGTAPGAVHAPDWPLDPSGQTVDHTVAPVDALRPGPAAPGSLNAGYRYVGAVTDYLLR